MSAKGISWFVEALSSHRAASDVTVGMIPDGRSRGCELSLVERAASGDVAAFEELYKGNVGRVYPLCLRMCADPILAEDLVQETFIRAWQKIGTFRGASAFSTWLHRIAVNVVLGHRRSRNRRQVREDLAGDRATFDVETRAAAPDDGLDLERAVAELPEGAREVFVLHDVEGYRHREIADMTGVAVGTSKAQLHRARKLLRKALSR
jgi:RNA polymerase sigma-70 factor (ECF subfamily)